MYSSTNRHGTIKSYTTLVSVVEKSTPRDTLTQRTVTGLNEELFDRINRTKGRKTIIEDLRAEGETGTLFFSTEEILRRQQLSKERRQEKEVKRQEKVSKQQETARKQVEKQAAVEQRPN